MHLDLTDRETEVLYNMLRDYLPTLQWEVARTEVRDLRHELVQRQDLIESLLDRLAPSAR
jgi:hypothetical protein